ncbi:MAG: DUF3373 domain-containing protein [Proteobacteria bacterium]|nr:DUF3373 domain-containing protein [Pseudomonadota bacterium]MBU1638900.1 DUF3373 domain-containing protein [Pseudomonadota bacterium]
MPTVGDLLAGLGPAMAGGQAAWVVAATGGFGLTVQQANVFWYMFTDPAMSTYLQANTGMLTTQLAGAASTFQGISSLMTNMTSANKAAMFSAMGYNVSLGKDYENETSYTTRLRMNMRVKATENIEVKARAVAYKFWGNQTSQNGETDEFGTHVTDANPYFLNSRSFDGTVGRQPGDSAIVLDRAFMNWNNIAGSPVWFSIGRRPTTDGPPAQLRMGSDQRMATPVNYMDYPFDGVSLGYAYNNLFGLTDGPGRIRFCYGRGFESGSSIEDTGMNDVDFAGLSWDVYKKGARFVNIQSFGAFNIFNVPGDTVFPSPYELGIAAAVADDTITQAQADVITANNGMNDNGVLDRKNMGNIFHTAAVYMDEIANLNYFATLGWSHTDTNDDFDEMGISLLSDSYAEPEDQDGYGVYVGVRYDLDDLGLKLGAEYNWGSEYWLAFTPGHDDMYSSKLQTRGSVYELYMIYDLPGGEAISKFGKAFMRLGYQHYDYEYSYSGMWLGAPTKIDDLADDPSYAQFYAPAESMDQVYLTLEAYF